MATLNLPDNFDAETERVAALVGMPTARVRSMVMDVLQGLSAFPQTDYEALHAENIRLRIRLWQHEQGGKR